MNKWTQFTCFTDRSNFFCDQIILIKFKILKVEKLYATICFWWNLLAIIEIITWEIDSSVHFLFLCSKNTSILKKINFLKMDLILYRHLFVFFSWVNSQFFGGFGSSFPIITTGVFLCWPIRSLVDFESRKSELKLAVK